MRPERLLMDGGEDGYEFTVGGHTGRFKVINSSPGGLILFRHKCWRLMDSFGRSAKSRDQDKTDGDDVKDSGRYYPGH